MRFPRGVVGVSSEGVVFVEDVVRGFDEGRVRKVALRAVGQFTKVVPVGRMVKNKSVKDLVVIL